MKRTQEELNEHSKLLMEAALQIMPEFISFLSAKQGLDPLDVPNVVTSMMIFTASWMKDNIGCSRSETTAIIRAAVIGLIHSSRLNGFDLELEVPDATTLDAGFVVPQDIARA